MSRTYSIACTKCRVHLWIAQSTEGRGYIYSGPDHALAHAAFLFAHINHSLVFADNVDGVAAEMDEIDVPGADPNSRSDPLG